jgi:hypothetical protein
LEVEELMRIPPVSTTKFIPKWKKFSNRQSWKISLGVMNERDQRQTDRAEYLEIVAHALAKNKDEEDESKYRVRNLLNHI